MNEKNLAVEFNAACKQIRKELGVRVRRNVMGCCRGCIAADAETKLGIIDEDTPIIWHYGGQGQAIDLMSDRVTRRSNDYWVQNHSTVDSIYFNHSSIDSDLMHGIQLIFQAHGFTSEWCGSENVALLVRFDSFDAYASVA